MSSDTSEYCSPLKPSDELPQINLTDEERHKLECCPTLTKYQREQLDRNAKKNWDLFYKRNGNRFFKNRYWTRHEFQELFEKKQTDLMQCANQLRYLLELGCGCGDFVLPLLEDIQDKEATCDNIKPANLFIYCCDISDRAIDILKANDAYKKNTPARIKAFVADITVEKVDVITSALDGQLMDIASLVFILSAIDPEKMQIAVKNINKLLKPGGMVLFRDYAIYDKAMIRFSAQSKIADQFYVRQDGTRAYFFTKEQLVNLFTNCNFHCQSIDYVKRETVNNATKDKYSRIFLQAKFMKLEDI